MFKQMYKGVELDVFDMYGIVDIRAGTIDRTAEVHHKDNVWGLDIYWTTDGEPSCDWKSYHYPTKEEAVEIGKDWVAFGTRPDRRWNDEPKS